MKFQITRDGENWEEFPIAHIQFSTDENGEPVDIVICGTEEVLLQIANYALVGSNIQPNTGIVWPITPETTHEGLFARLPHFQYINKIMRYKISYGPDAKRDRWGHEVKAAPVYEMYFDSLLEAENAAMQISKEHKKWTVSIYDTQGPQEDPEDSQSNVWLIKSFERGKVYENPNYLYSIS